MKKNYILLLLLTITHFCFSTEKTTNPSIGLILSAPELYDDNFINYGYRTFNFSVKNTGDEVLTNITISNAFGIELSNCVPNSFGFPCSISPISTLNPNQEVFLTGYLPYYMNSNCNDSFYATVEATTISNSTISDISDYSSYLSNFTTSVQLFSYFTQFLLFDTYIDVNSNNIIDVGDQISYELNAFIYSNGIGSVTDYFDINPINVYNNNPVTVSNQYGNIIGQNPVYITYNITAQDIATGYVFYSPYIVYNSGNCGSYSIDHINPCATCPNPDNCSYGCIKTRLTDLYPNKIAGNVKFNSQNNNCATGINYPNRRITANNSGVNHSTFTNSQGNYEIIIPNVGTYSTSALVNLSSNFTSNPTNYSFSSSGSNVTYNADFCISSANNLSDLKVFIVPITDAVPGFSSAYNIYAQNIGSTSLNGSVTFSFDNSKLTLVQQNPTSNSNTTNSLTWNFSNLLPLQNKVYNVGFNVMTPPTVQSGTVLTFNATSTQNLTDNNPVDNQFTLNQTAVNSFDPNDKTILEGAFISPTQATGYLHFLTRFQNEGTSAAINIEIKETLSNRLNWNTFEPIDSSHPCNIQLKYGDQLSYVFNNINLPNASANEPASHGWILYKVKPNNYFPVGHVISSSSDIYFDYNSAITTNTATTQIQVLSTETVTKDFFKLYPNPVKDELNISPITTENYMLSIIDINGKLIYTTEFSGDKTIDVSSYKSGFYFINIKNENANQNYKLIKN